MVASAGEGTILDVQAAARVATRRDENISIRTELLERDHRHPGVIRRPLLFQLAHQFLALPNHPSGHLLPPAFSLLSTKAEIHPSFANLGDGAVCKEEKGEQDGHDNVHGVVEPVQQHEVNLHDLLSDGDESHQPQAEDSVFFIPLPGKEIGELVQAQRIQSREISVAREHHVCAPSDVDAVDAKELHLDEGHGVHLSLHHPSQAGVTEPDCALVPALGIRNRRHGSEETLPDGEQRVAEHDLGPDTKFVHEHRHQDEDHREARRDLVEHADVDL
mmetsp:Transcript_56563/g.183215  ORF Transcript_56563/g.183215 Transcript_56563/m.183215 type:complete len:275 (-) Transcript_56563:673-1497(-)